MENPIESVNAACTADSRAQSSLHSLAAALAYELQRTQEENSWYSDRLECLESELDDLQSELTEMKAENAGLRAEMTRMRADKEV